MSWDDYDPVEFGRELATGADLGQSDLEERKRGDEDQGGGISRRDRRTCG